MLTHCSGFHRDRLACFWSHWFFFSLPIRSEHGWQSLWFGCFYLSECGTQGTALKEGEGGDVGCRTEAATARAHETKETFVDSGVMKSQRTAWKTENKTVALNLSPWKQPAMTTLQLLIGLLRLSRSFFIFILQQWEVREAQMCFTSYNPVCVN